MITLAALDTQAYQQMPVHYVQLARDTEVRESQKDVLSQALRLAFPKVAVFTENTEAKKDGWLLLRCLNCVMTTDDALLDVSSFKKEVISENKDLLRFAVHSGTKINIWNVELELKYPRYTVVATHSLKYGGILTASDMRVEICKEGMPCRSENSYESPEDTEKIVTSWAGQKLQAALPQGALIPNNVVTMPNLVKINDEVRIVYELDGLRISAKGRALGNGVKGASVRVELQNRSDSGFATRHTVDAIVRAAGEVEYVR